MKKMGGTICDMCRVLIYERPVPFQRKAKKGQVMDFCSEGCKTKDEETLQRSQNGILKKNLSPQSLS